MELFPSLSKYDFETDKVKLVDNIGSNVGVLLTAMKNS